MRVLEWVALISLREFVELAITREFVVLAIGDIFREFATLAIRGYVRDKFGGVDVLAFCWTITTSSSAARAARAVGGK